MNMDLLKKGKAVYVKDAFGGNSKVADNLLGSISGLEDYDVITGNNSEYVMLSCNPYAPDTYGIDYCRAFYADLGAGIAIRAKFRSHLGQFGTEERFWQPLRHARDLLQSWRR